MDKEELLGLLKSKVLVLDGAMGTMMQKYGFANGCPERLNLKNPELIKKIHKGYADAGADIIVTNTFGANGLKLKDYDLQDSVRELNESGVRIAREAAPNCIIAGNIGPLGKYIEPLDKLTFDEAYEVFTEQVKALHGADVLLIETIADVKVLKAALIAARENSNLPIFCSVTFEGDRTVTGTDAETFVEIAESLGADVIGINCGAGPKEHYEILAKLVKYTNKPIFTQANAGLPEFIDGKTVFKEEPSLFAEYSKKFVELGVGLIGGCCGTTTDHIKAIVEAVKDFKPLQRNNVRGTKLCSRTKTVIISPTLIVGERINPTNKGELQTEIRECKTRIIQEQALLQVKEGATLLDINVGVPGADEVEVLKKSVEVIQNVVDVPLVIDTGDIVALEGALKKSDGKALVNSVHGSKKSLEKVLPVVKKYGAAVIALAFDEKGIPKTKDGRVEVARRIIDEALKIGMRKEDIIVDLVTMTIATNPDIDNVLVDTIKDIKELGYRTILGISNISHGLPNRQEINSKFLTKASKAGLDMAIINPLDNIMQEDTEIRYLEDSVKIKREDYDKMPIEQQLYNSILYGDKDNITDIIEKGLEKFKALEINDIFIKALGEVGDKFNKKIYFLPQVLLSAAAMKTAFKRLKSELKKEGGKYRGRILISTVENDIHDIGKNIVSALLESHSYKVVDLGKNVPKEEIFKKAIELKPDLVALSALMTTTVKEMENVISDLRERDIKVAVIVGGAVVTKEYAESIGAHYAKNALDAVKVIDRLVKYEKDN